MDPIEAILEAEARPAFRHNGPVILALLERADDAEALDLRWKARAALRQATVHLQASDHEAADAALQRADEALDALGGEPWMSGLRHIQGLRLRLRRDGLDAAPQELAALVDFPPHHPDLTALDRLRLETMARLVEAEVASARGQHPLVTRLLEPRIHMEGAFAQVDDLWQSLHLLGLAALMSLRPHQAAPFMRAAADLCRIHEATQDLAEALAALGNVEILCGRTQEGVAAMEEAAELSGDGASEYTRRLMLTTARFGAGDVQGAIDAAERAAIVAANHDDYHGYMTMVGVIIALYVDQGRHKDAYRNLLHIASSLNARLGAEAARPALNLLDRLRETIGQERFEAIAEELLAELQGH